MEMEVATTYSERRLIREELQRLEVEGVSLDPATKCRCECGNVHYRKRVANENQQPITKAMVTNDRDGTGELDR